MKNRDFVVLLLCAGVTSRGQCSTGFDRQGRPVTAALGQQGAPLTLSKINFLIGSKLKVQISGFHLKAKTVTVDTSL